MSSFTALVSFIILDFLYYCNSVKLDIMNIVLYYVLCQDQFKAANRIKKINFLNNFIDIEYFHNLAIIDNKDLEFEETEAYNYRDNSWNDKTFKTLGLAKPLA